MSQENDKRFFTLFTAVVIAICVIMVVFYFMGAKYGEYEKKPISIKPSSVAPASSESSASGSNEEVAAASGPADGKTVYDQVCVACHSGALPGVPKHGEQADWGPRLAKGIDTLYDHAIHGFNGVTMPMPPKGGANLSDDETKAAVDYMVKGVK